MIGVLVGSPKKSNPGRTDLPVQFPAMWCSSAVIVPWIIIIRPSVGLLDDPLHRESSCIARDSLSAGPHSVLLPIFYAGR